MKWDKVALVVIEDTDDVVIANDIKYYIDRYNIPSHLIVKINEPIHRFIYDLRGGSLRGGLTTLTGVLAGHLTQFSKIIILAHGSEPPDVRCAGLDAILMSRILKVLGVSEVGLISFKSCHIGSGSYLDEFTTACASENIRFGWCLAYISDANRLLNFGRIFHFKRQTVGHFDSLLYVFSCGCGKLSDAYRVKVIKGTLTLPAEFVKTLGPRFDNGMTSSSYAVSYNKYASNIFDV
ncbi:hypothetical protein [Enterobacter mori]|uniref:hypothetical protein n=1 Tax=Enterobacter mori TaxID=539813 RepID=UPI003B8441D1